MESVSHRKSNRSLHYSSDIQRSKVQVQHKGQTIALDISSITLFESDGNYTFIYTAMGQKYLLSKTLKVVTSNIEGNFVRVHKSFIINSDFITSYIRRNRTLKMACGKEVQVSRRKKKEMDDILRAPYANTSSDNN